MVYFINKEICYMVLNNIDCFSISNQLFICQRCCSYKVKMDDSHYIVTVPKSSNKAIAWVHAKPLQLYPSLCYPMDHTLTGSCVHVIL